MQLHITPSLITLPDAVAESLSTRPGCQDFSEYLANHKKWLFLRGKAPAGDIKDIICLPEISTVLEGKVPVPLSVMFGLPPLFYTPEEYLQILTSALAVDEIIQILSGRRAAAGRHRSRQRPAPVAHLFHCEQSGRRVAFQYPVPFRHVLHQGTVHDFFLRGIPEPADKKCSLPGRIQKKAAAVY